MAGGSNKRPWLIHYIGLLSITFTIVTGMRKKKKEIIKRDY